jgi:hypothetical protein
MGRTNGYWLGVDLLTGWLHVTGLTIWHQCVFKPRFEQHDQTVPIGLQHPSPTSLVQTSLGALVIV